MEVPGDANQVGCLHGHSRRLRWLWFTEYYRLCTVLPHHPLLHSRLQVPGAVGGSTTTDGSPEGPEATPSAGTQDELAVSTDDRLSSISGFSDLLQGSDLGHVKDLFDDDADVPEALHGEGKRGGAVLAECALLSSHLDRPVELRLTGKGPGSEPPVTVVQLFQQAAERHAARKALCVKRVGVWKTWTYQKYYDDSVALAKAFIKVCSPVFVVPFSLTWHI